MKQFLKEILDNNPRLKKMYRMYKTRSLKGSTVSKKLDGVNNHLEINGSVFFNNSCIYITGSNNTLVIEQSCFFKNCKIEIRGNGNRIVISKNVEFSRGGDIWIEDNDCEIFIGDNSTFEDVHLAVTENNSKLKIGSDCMFAYGIDVRTGDSHSIINAETGERLNNAQDVNIGNHVWVAAHVSILKGAAIASNCIVATRSVVTKSFIESNILIGGIPSKVLKSNVNWDRARL